VLDGPVIAEWLPVSVAALVLLLIAAGVAGWVDAVVGGGGLIQLPALVIAVPKDVATPFILGTNKLSSFFGTLSASWVYLRKIRVQLVLLIPLVAGAYAGSTAGAALSRFVPREVGFYDGILGPGTGSFFVILIVSVLGYGFLQASVNAKIANLTTNLAALAVYGVHGEILLVLGLAMAAMNVTGGFIGAHMATRRGSGFVRVVFLVTLSILIVKLAWDTVVQFTS